MLLGRGCESEMKTGKLLSALCTRYDRTGAVPYILLPALFQRKPILITENLKPPPFHAWSPPSRLEGALLDQMRESERTGETRER